MSLQYFEKKTFFNKMSFYGFIAALCAKILCDVGLKANNIFEENAQ
jgi:hypothetical protein